MKPKSLPVLITQDSPARRAYRIEAPDQYATKYLALFLIDRGIYFFFLGSFCGLVQPEICFSIPKTEIQEIERCLENLPTARPSSAQPLSPHLYPEADAGHLDLEDSQRTLAQVSSQADTEYIANLWSAFRPASLPETVNLAVPQSPLVPVSMEVVA
jgi:hypothetical protein